MQLRAAAYHYCVHAVHRYILSLIGNMEKNICMLGSGLRDISDDDGDNGKIILSLSLCPAILLCRSSPLCLFALFLVKKRGRKEKEEEEK